MLFAADIVKVQDSYVTSPFWTELGDPALDDKTREFSDRLCLGTLKNLDVIDEKIKTRAEHWRIERMALVDRNVLRLAVYEFLYEDTPHTVVINEALEVARRFSTFEATQFINGILDAIKLDLEKADKTQPDAKSHASSN
jgi:N utilization substance protein B